MRPVVVINWLVAPADGTGGDLLVKKEGHSPQATPRTIDLHHATSNTGEWDRTIGNERSSCAVYSLKSE